jgi:adenine-specific DNA-methyltransferase
MACTFESPFHDPLEEVREILGEPALEFPGVLLYQGDCLHFLRHLPTELIDLTVTSPPYNIGKEYEFIRATDEYLNWCATWMTEVHRVTTKAGAFWLNLGYFEVPALGKAVPIPYLLWNRSAFYLMQEIVWHYGAGVGTKKTFAPRNEKFLWFVKDREGYVFNLDEVRDPNVKYPNQKKNGKLKCNPLGKNPSDVWMFPKVTSGRLRSSKERTEHPAQFPTAVIERIVRACSNRGDLLLDPFMGSGTVAEVGLRTGRPVLGFEIYPKYIDTAGRRISEVIQSLETEKSQGLLF